MKKIDNNAVLIELGRRVKKNDVGVRGYLAAAGIKPAGEVSLENLNDLYKIDSESFYKLLQFLYPEITANADESEVLQTSNGTKWSASDWTGMVGTILDAGVGVLSTLNINGNTDAQTQAEMLRYMSEQEKSATEKKQMRNTILIVCLGFLVVVVAGVLIFKRRR